jgi:hypothetical protein
MLLRFAHLGGSHHLHCLGDLRGIADRFYPTPYVLRVRHLFDVRCWLFGFQETARHLPRDFEVTDFDLKFVKRL